MPTNYISDFWSHGYIVRQDGNLRGEKIKIKIREIEEEHRSKAMYFVRPWGQFPPGCMKLWVQWISWSQLIQRTMTHQASHTLRSTYLCLRLSLFWFIWPEPLSQRQEDVTTCDEITTDPTLKHQGKHIAVFHPSAMNGWYGLNHVSSDTFQDLLHLDLGHITYTKWQP